MSTSGSGGESLTSSAALDWHELSGVERITPAFAIGEHSVVMETTDGREIRITAWHDRARDQYISEYERRSVLKSILDVDRIKIY